MALPWHCYEGPWQGNGLAKKTMALAWKSQLMCILGRCTLFNFFVSRHGIPHGVSWHVFGRAWHAVALPWHFMALYGIPRTVMVLLIHGNAMGVPWVSMAMP